MRKGIVTIGTDGFADFVELADGQRLTLGAVPMMTFVTELTTDLRYARRALDTFLKDKRAVLTVDLDDMDALLTTPRKRWSSKGVDPLMTLPNRTPTMSRQGQVMDAKVLFRRVWQMEQRLARLNKLASEGLSEPKLVKELRWMAANIHLTDFGDQSNNHAFYDLGAPKVDTADPKYIPPTSVTHPSGTDGTAPATVTNPKMASFDALQANTKTVSDILASVKETTARVDALVTAGRKFDADRAKGDLLKVASRVAEILQNVDLAQPWVANDLGELTKRASHLHGLFAVKAKV